VESLGHEEQVLGRAYDARLMRRLMAYVRPYKGSAFLALLFILSASALSVLPPYLTKVAIDRYIRNADMGGLNLVAALYVATLAGTFGFSFGQTCDWRSSGTFRNSMWLSSTEILSAG
jgi:ATP-binding cassette subfamily B multidrug efflux pump